jgi:tetratricopeptide (TPR) repeat protein
MNQRTIAIIIACTAALCYANALAGGWTLDDPYIVVGNPLVHTPSVVWAAFTHPYWPAGLGWGQYRPLVILGFALDWAVSGGSPVWFHLVNVAWHVTASILVWRLARTLLPSPGDVIAALWFAVQPVHVEAVAGVVGRAEIMAATFVLAGLLAHAHGRRRAIIWYALALASKESGAVMVGLALCYDVLCTADWKATLSLRRRLYAGYGAVLGVYGVVLAMLFHGRQLVQPALLWGGMPAITRWLTMCTVIPHYLRLMVAPAQLLVDYGPAIVEPQSGLTPSVIVGLLILGVWCAALAAAWRRAPVVAFGLLWFAVAILPIANIVFPSGVVLAERTLYLPSVGAALIIGWCAVRLLSARRLVVSVGLAVAGLLLAARTWTRVPLWHDNKSVIVGSLNDEPESYRMHMLAAMVLVQGNRWGDAGAQYARARHLYAKDATSYRAGAECAMAIHDLPTAARLLDSAIAIAPSDVRPVLRLADVRAGMGDWPGVMAAARRAYDMAPDSLRAVQLVRDAAGHVGDTAVVDTTFRRALADHPNNARLRLAYAALLHQRGDTAAAFNIAVPGIGAMVRDAP